jgi:hypothetical protein
MYKDGDLRHGVVVLVLGLILAVILSGPSSIKAPAADHSEFSIHVEEFNAAWNKFYRKLHGCPTLAIRIDECEETLAMVDLKLWKEVVKKMERLR